MPDIMTAQNQDQFIPELWASIAIGMFFDRCVMPKLVGTDFKNVVATKGNTVNIGERGTLVAKDKAQGSAVTPQAPTGSMHSIVLDKHKEVTFLVEDVTEAQSAVKNMMGYMDDATKVLAGEVDTDLLELYASCSQSKTVTTDITEPVVLGARRLLNQAQVPMDGRFLVLDESQDKAMLQIERFTDASKVGIAGMITEGAIGRIHGFDVFTDPRVVVTLTSPAQAHGLAFQRVAFQLVVRPLPLPPPGLGTTGIYVVQDNVALRLLYSYSADYLGVQCTLDVLYGCKLLRDKAAVVVNTAYTAES